MAHISTVKYATFGQRFASFLIDTILLVLLQWFAGAMLGHLIGQSMADDYANGYVTLEEIEQKATAWAWIIGISVSWLYFSLFESSEKQATPGKMAVGLMVTDLSGDRLGFGHATGRHFSRIISGIPLCIGYLAPLWTQKKQAFHDIISGCLVIEGTPRATQNEQVRRADASNGLVNDEALYLFATEEFAGPSRQAGLWAKVLALHDGHEEKAKFSYIRERVAQLQAASAVGAIGAGSSQSLTEPMISEPQANSDGMEFWGEQGETNRFPDAKAAAEFSSKRGVIPTPTQKLEAIKVESKPESELPTAGLSLQERSARLEAALKAATARKR